MWISLIWTVVLSADLIIWALYRRFHRLHLLGNQISFLRRSMIVEAKPINYTGPPREVPERVRRMLAIGDGDADGFAPSASVQMAVDFIVLLQNAIVIGAVRSQGAAEEVCRRSGQLAFANTVPLVLLAFPDIALGRLVRQCKPEVAWLHHLFGWLVWLNTMVHVGLSKTIATGTSSMILSVFGLCGIVILYLALLSKARAEPRHVTRNTPARERELFTGHSILGAVFLFVILVHAPTGTSLVVASMSCTFLVVGILCRKSRGVSVEMVRKIDAKDELRGLWAVSCRLDNVGITDAQEYYFEVNGKPARVAWTRNQSSRDEASFSVTILAKVERGNQAIITGPCIGFASPYVSAPCSLVIYCSDSENSFSAAHKLLHARKAHSKDSTTFIMCVAPKDRFLERFYSEHKCPYEECIKSVHDVVRAEPAAPARIIHPGEGARRESCTVVLDSDDSGQVEGMTRTHTGGMDESNGHQLDIKGEEYVYRKMAEY